MDINAGKILKGAATLDEVGHEIYEAVLRVASGGTTASEEMGHAEFSLVYKSFDALGPACLAK